MPKPLSRRVVITGVGLVSPLGNHREALWTSLQAGRSGIDTLTSIPTQTIACGGEARDFSGKVDDFGEVPAGVKRQIRKGLKVMCREIQMGVAAAQLAMQDADLVLGQYDCDRIGVVYGSDYIMTLPDEFALGVSSCVGPDAEFRFTEWAERGLPKVTPLWLLKYLPNMPASHIAIYNDLRGPNNSLTLREASANLAISEAATTIARGSADQIIAGATGTRIHPLRTIHVALQEELAIGSDPAGLSRPFDLDRQGSVLGEGAGAMVLEDSASAESRGAKILGEVVSFGSSTVINRRGVAQREQAIENALRIVLDSAERAPHEIGHLHAHGLGTRKCDMEEATAIERIFGTREQPLPVVAAKSYFGNLGAGSGMVETISSLLALEQDSLFPILNYVTPDPQCQIVPAEMNQPPGDSFVNVNVSPQAQASAILIQRFESR